MTPAADIQWAQMITVVVTGPRRLGRVPAPMARAVVATTFLAHPHLHPMVMAVLRIATAVPRIAMAALLNVTVAPRGIDSGKPET